MYDWIYPGKEGRLASKHCYINLIFNIKKARNWKSGPLLRFRAFLIDLWLSVNRILLVEFEKTPYLVKNYEKSTGNLKRYMLQFCYKLFKNKR